MLAKFGMGKKTVIVLKDKTMEELERETAALEEGRIIPAY